MESVKIECINAKSDTKKIKWQRRYGWILVGGKNLDRGVTVEGLTVSYIPRKKGAGFADVIQQRGRFFGYKENYIDYCRVFLLAESREAFTEYVRHEESLRREIQASIETKQKAKDWVRTFLLSPKLNPCRPSVVEEFTRGGFSDQWFAPIQMPVDKAFVDHNRKVIDDFLGKRKLNTVHAEVAGEGQKRGIWKVAPTPSLQEIQKELLLSYQFLNGTDTGKFRGAIYQISLYINNHTAAAEEKCDVYIMGSEKFPRTRPMDKNDKISSTLFQGHSTRYAGDREMPENKNNIVVQIHNLNLFVNETSTVHEKVPILALWIPQKFSVPSWIIKDVEKHA